MIRYSNATVLSEKGWLNKASFDVIDGRFETFYACDNTRSPSIPDRQVDLEGKYVLPGIIDIHLSGVLPQDPVCIFHLKMR